MVHELVCTIVLYDNVSSEVQSPQLAVGKPDSKTCCFAVERISDKTTCKLHQLLGLGRFRHVRGHVRGQPCVWGMPIYVYANLSNTYKHACFVRWLGAVGNLKFKSYSFRPP